MCNADRTMRSPETRIAEAMKADLGVDVAPEAVRAFILKRWPLLTGAAHRIHDDEAERDKMRYVYLATEMPNRAPHPCVSATNGV